VASDEEPASRTSIRFTATGDVEVFDGENWRPVESIVDDPDLGNRDDLLAPRSGRTDQPSEASGEPGPD
jgi:hypothetical protein